MVESPFICLKCTASFARVDTIDNHILKCHIARRVLIYTNFTDIFPLKLSIFALWPLNLLKNIWSDENDIEKEKERRSGRGKDAKIHTQISEDFDRTLDMIDWVAKKYIIV